MDLTPLAPVLRAEAQEQDKLAADNSGNPQVAYVHNQLCGAFERMAEQLEALTPDLPLSPSLAASSAVSAALRGRRPPPAVKGIPRLD